MSFSGVVEVSIHLKKLKRWQKEALMKYPLYPDNLHWLVSDTTQALTFSLGEYFNVWFEWYLYVYEHSTFSKVNRGVMFESYCTAISSLLHL